VPAVPSSRAGIAGSVKGFPPFLSRRPRFYTLPATPQGGTDFCRHVLDTGYTPDMDTDLRLPYTTRAKRKRALLLARRYLRENPREGVSLLAAKMGLHRTTVWHWSRGTRLPRAEHVNVLLKVLS
jgi:hypothetical protein